MALGTLPGLDERAEQLFRRWGINGRVVGLNPGASFGPSKLWTPEGFARVSDLVQTELGARTVLLCGPGEEALADAITARAKEPIIDTSRDVIPLDLLKSVVARLDALVTTDTGPRHFAAALDVPVVVIMGPTDPRYTETNLGSTRVLRRIEDCAPCHKKVCDTDHRCMRGITGEEVFASLKELI
jgi:heptosyltransferase-2